MDAIFIGSSSAIAQACLTQFRLAKPDHSIYTVSRNPEKPAYSDVHFASDYSEQSIEEIGKSISRCSFSHAFIFNGLLHHDQLQPEKKLEDLKLENLRQVFQANVFTQTLWLKALAKPLKHDQTATLVALSARVGSISDNHLGGWYSYRASKAALNMVLQSAAFEFAHRAKRVKLISFHPGTTDSALSKPFQGNVPEEKLFSPEFVAQQLLSVCVTVPRDNTLSYIDYAGKPIPF